MYTILRFVQMVCLRSMQVSTYQEFHDILFAVNNYRNLLYQY